MLKIFQHGTRIFDLRFFDDTEYLRRGLTMTWYALADHQGSPPYSLYYKAPGRVAC